MNLYVGNLNYKVRESDLREVMEEYGTVDSVRIITDRETRRSKGFAFIEMPILQKHLTLSCIERVLNTEAVRW